MKKFSGEFIDVCCPVCEGLEFMNIDYFKMQSAKQKLVLCKNCGHIMYNPQPKNDELINFYKNKYRMKVGLGNIVTTARKLEYHKLFLGKTLENGKGKRMIDVGCATGYILAYAKTRGWEAVGTEHTTGFVNFARGEHGLDIRDDLNSFDGHFDFISYYHVLEHIQNPHMELKKAREKLKEDGLLYIAIPYFEKLRDHSGAGLTALDVCFPVEHINLFSHLGFKNMLAKVGFEIIRTNKHFYGLTVLCKKCELRPDDESYKSHSPKQVLETLNSMKMATDLYRSGDFEGATEAFADFPEAWISLSMQAKKFKDTYNILHKALKIMPTTAEISEQLGNTLLRNNAFEDALSAYKYALALRPGSDSAMLNMALCYAELEEYEEMIKICKRGISINPGNIANWYKWIGWAYSKMGG